MDLTNALVEAAASYRKRQDVLAKQIRIGSVAYALLGKLVDGKEGDRVLGALYGDMAYQTRRVERVPNPVIAVHDAAQRSVALAIAAIHADFEWACRDLLADALEFWSCWTPSLGTAKPPPKEIAPLAKRGWAGTVSEVLHLQSANESFVTSCYSLLQLPVSREDLAFLPLFDLFRRCRNRVLHQDGTAGRDLVEFAKSTEVRMAFQSLSGPVRRMAVELPAFQAAEIIVLTPAHAILFLIVVRALFNALSAHIRSFLDEDGYLRMVAHYAYGAAYHPFRKTNYRNVDDPARQFLNQRYHVIGPHDMPLVNEFRRLVLWDEMVIRFNELFSPRRPGRRAQ